ncbi:hypothetical protein VTL71DRAFT_8660 [Oculimacula yallundae]|uniref:Uncharacterized protein n=1 Tax=Oculimacula yallundae TaxID=86028 RepID=A0ABR4D0G8_9HELO
MALQLPSPTIGVPTNTAIPLTTTFTPATSCLSEYYIYSINPSSVLDYYLSLGPSKTSNCFPASWAPTSQYFSPGICPSDYSAACWITTSIGTDIETQATCCPLGYTCVTLPTPNTDAWLPSLYKSHPCEGTGGHGSTIGTYAVTEVKDGTTVVRNTARLAGVNAYGVSIRYKAADFAKVSSTSMPVSSRAVTTSTSGAATTSPAATDPAKVSDSGLSTGAKVGIGAGVAALAVIVAAVFFFIVKRRRRNHHEATLHAPKQDTSQHISEMAGS